MKTLVATVTLLFAWGLFFGGTIACYKNVPKEMIEPETGTGNFDTSAKRYLALGDSYTIGQSVQPGERFPAQTKALLQLDSIKMNEPEYIATTGWTTLNLSAAITAINPPHNYDLVSLLIGVNDQYQLGDTTGYRQHFTDLLLTAITLAAGKKDHVFVLSIPDYSVTPFAAGSDTARIRKQLDEFNAINLAVSAAYHVSYTYITDLTRNALTDPSLLAVDGLHPSGKAYYQWAQILAPKMISVLR